MAPNSSAHNIIYTFIQTAGRAPGHTALVQDGQTVTYAELLSGIRATARHYLARGIGKGDKVLVFVPMSIGLYRVVLALLYIGACPVFLDEWVSLPRLKACLNTVPCKAIVAPRWMLLLAWFIAPLRHIPIRLRPDSISRDKDDIAFSPAEVKGIDTALVTFTTGSTGTPKAADRTHAYLAAQLQALSPLLGSVRSPCLTLLPIVVLLHLATGKTAILPPRRFKARKPGTIGHLAATIHSNQPQSLIASPALVAVLTDRPDRELKAAFDTITSVLTGGGPVYPDLAQSMLEAFPNAAITAVYGSTEAEPISHIPAEVLALATPETLLTKGLPLGHTDPAAEVAILNLEARPELWKSESDREDNFRRSLNAPGVAGEIIVAGPHVLRHYINNPAAEAQTKLYAGVKVWHRTGDCGLLDPNGQLYLLGRCQERLHWNGHDHHPAMIAYALRIQAGVSGSALLFHKGKPLLVLEKKDRHARSGVEDCLAHLGLKSADILFIKKIPKDPRHQTKMDYEQLRRIVIS